LDVEDDEEHRRQVEADREPLLLRRSRRHAGLERDHAGARPGLRAGREDERERDHRQRDRECEQPVDQERQPAVEHARFPPPSLWRADLTNGPNCRTKGPENRGTKLRRGVTKSPRFGGLGASWPDATMGSWQPSKNPP